MHTLRIKSVNDSHHHLTPSISLSIVLLLSSFVFFDTVSCFMFTVVPVPTVAGPTPTLLSYSNIFTSTTGYYTSTIRMSYYCLLYPIDYYSKSCGILKLLVLGWTSFSTNTLPHLYVVWAI